MNECNLKDAGFLAQILKFEKLSKLCLNFNDFHYLPNNLSFDSAKSLKILEIRDSHISNFNFLISITKCRTLEKLNISCNKFRDIPANFSFGDAAETLIELRASACNFNSHEILFALTNCTRLKRLFIDSNLFGDIRYPYSFGKSKKSLILIDISKCGCSSSNLFELLTDCPNLKSLIANNNNFFGKQTSIHIKSSKNSLTTLYLNTGIAQSVSSQNFLALTSFKNLKSLVLTANFTDKQYNIGTSKYSLQDVNISDSKLNSLDLIRCILDCPKLVTLNVNKISMTEFQEEIEEDIIGQSKTSLDWLSAKKCGFTSVNVLLVFSSFEKLTFLDFSKNKLIDNYNEGALDLSKNRSIVSNNGIILGQSKNSLITLNFKKCNLKSASAIENLTNCPNLTTLDLSYNCFSNMVSDLRFGASKSKLRNLSLSHSSIKINGWKNALLECKQLAQLDLSGLSLKGFDEIFNNKYLKNSIRELNLVGCQKISPETIRSISSLRYLKTLYINRFFMNLIKQPELQRFQKTLENLILIMDEGESILCTAIFKQMIVEIFSNTNVSFR